MQHLISGSLAAIGQLVYKRVILAVTVLFCVGVAVAMTNMSDYDILRNKYQFEDRGIIHVKGKGDMNTYLLEGRLVSSQSV
ncbi:MAG: hypothetical protein P2A85_05465 [Microcoleus anatoxicus]|uniref:hypothetical protein n=1 Tax=Microcoleus anatoxicus TaxID=2705319 RepID=UPI00366CF286